MATAHEVRGDLDILGGRLLFNGTVYPCLVRPISGIVPSDLQEGEIALDTQTKELCLLISEDTILRFRPAAAQSFPGAAQFNQPRNSHLIGLFL